MDCRRDYFPRVTKLLAFAPESAIHAVKQVYVPNLRIVIIHLSFRVRSVDPPLLIFKFISNWINFYFFFTFLYYTQKLLDFYEHLRIDRTNPIAQFGLVEFLLLLYKYQYYRLFRSIVMCKARLRWVSYPVLGSFRRHFQNCIVCNWKNKIRQKIKCNELD